MATRNSRPPESATSADQPRANSNGGRRAVLQVADPTGAAASQVIPSRPNVNLFVAEYLRDNNGRRAAIAAGYSPATAVSQASRLLKNVKVRAQVAKHQAEIIRKLQDETGITKARALQEAWAIVIANPNELIQWRVLCCKDCHGRLLAIERRERQPDPECITCLGDGIGRALVQDTRRLSPQALALYAGVKVTKEGLEVKMHSKMDALEKVFKHLGLYKADNDQKKSEAEVLAQFVSEIHESGAGRLQFAPQIRR